MHKVRTEPREDIRQRREAAGMTMAALAEILQLNSATIYHWEHGHFKVAAQYERDLQELFDSLEAGSGVPQSIVERALERSERKRIIREAGGYVPQPRTLTKMKRALGYIQAYIARHGYAPTYTEVGQGIGAPSAHSTGRHLVNLLVKCGYLNKTADSPQFRGPFDLTPKGEEPV